MSFGFSISDFITVVELAKRMRKEFAGAPSQFDHISKELRSLFIVLQDTDIILSTFEADEQQKASLHEIASSCDEILLDLEKTLGKYSELATVGQGISKNVKRVWKILRWEPEDIRDLRDRLTSNITLLSISFGQMSSQTISAAKKGVDRLNMQQDNHERLTILDWLTTVDYAPLQSDLIRRQQAGTGQWLLDAPEFQAWLESAKGTLFCPGIPGGGKTMVTAIVIDHLTTRFGDHETIGIAYVYCDFRRTHEQRLEDLLASLLKQLAQSQPSLPRNVKVLYDRHIEKRTRASFDEVSKALQSVVAMCSKAFIIVDALDECQISDGCRSRFVAEIFNLVAKYGVGFLATSRFNPDIVDKFSGSPSLEIRATAEDVRRYVDGHLSQLPSFVGRDPPLMEEVAAGIVRAADGMFLLAQLHLDSLIGKKSPKALRRALADLPSGSDAYDHAYQSAMERIEGQTYDQEELAKQVLSWITCAKRPLITIELQHALAVEVGERDFDEDNVPQLEDMVSVCAGLVTVDEKSSVIRLVHYTTQEFFERTQQQWFPNAASEITRICITYLSFAVFGKGFCQTDAGIKELLRSNPFYHYAANNWGHHARRAMTPHQDVRGSLQSYNKAEASSQALMEKERSLASSGYSQEVAWEMTRLRVAAYLENAVKALHQESVDDDLENFYGQTPLSMHRHDKFGPRKDTEILKLAIGFLSKGNSNWEAWRASVEQEDAKQQNRVAEVNLPGPLYYSVKLRLRDVVISLIKDASCDVNESSCLGSALSIACSIGAVDFALLLLEKGANATVTDKHGRAPIHLASRNGHVEVVKLLLENGTKPAQSESSGWATKHAAGGGNGANVCDAAMKTPLHYSVLHSWTRCTELLLKQGAEMSADVDNMTALHYTVLKTNEEMAQCLLDAGVTQNTGVKRQTWQRIHQGDKVLHVLNNDDVMALGLISAASKGLQPCTMQP